MREFIGGIFLLVAMFVGIIYLVWFLYDYWKFKQRGKVAWHYHAFYALYGITHIFVLLFCGYHGYMAVTQ